jgi:hypothetical protein
VGPCYHGMAHHQAVDGEDGLQMCKVVMNRLSKQHGQPRRGGPPAWGSGEG